MCTTPWTEEVGSRRERRARGAQVRAAYGFLRGAAVAHPCVSRADDSREGGGRERLPRTRKNRRCGSKRKCLGAQGCAGVATLSGT
jgi:hypothetical protein